MHIKHLIATIVTSWFGSGFVAGQGWVLKVEVDINHGDCALEQLTTASVQFGGTSGFGSSTGSRTTILLNGTGPPSGTLIVSANGICNAAYDPTNPVPPFSASYSDNLSFSNCNQLSYNSYTPGAMSDVSGMITFYPRLDITDHSTDCQHISITSAYSCGNGLIWGFSDAVDGPWYEVVGKTSQEITVTADELFKSGFMSRYGMRFLRVSDAALSGRTSEVEVINIFAAPPEAIFTTTEPACHNGSDGTAELEISSSEPTTIDDFVVTLYNQDNPSDVLGSTFPVQNAFTLVINSLSASTYRIKVTNNSNVGVLGACSNTYSNIIVSNPTAVNTSLSASDFNGFPIRCSGGSDGEITANGTGGSSGYTYEWNTGATSKKITGLGAGTYSVTTIDQHGCQSYKSIAIQDPPVLLASISSLNSYNGFEVSCLDKADGQIKVSASQGVGGYTFEWEDGRSESILSGLSAGSYSVTAYDLNGCAAEASIALNAPDPIDFEIRTLSELVCHGDHTASFRPESLQNTIGEISYIWSSGETTAQIDSKGSGQYALTVSDEQGCKTQKSILVSEPPAYTSHLTLLSDYNGSAIRCFGEENAQLAVSLVDEADEELEPDYYHWFKADESYQDGPSLNQLANLGTGAYRVVIEYNKSCQSEGTIIIEEPEQITPSIEILSDYSGSAVSCPDSSDGSILVTATGGVGDYSYSWDSGSATPQLNGIGAGTYTAIVTDANSCFGSASMTIHDPEPVMPAINLVSDYHGSAISCNGASDGVLAASATGGTGSYTYAWSTGVTTVEVTSLASGGYAVTATDENGCSGVNFITLTEPEIIQSFIEVLSNYHGLAISCSDASDARIRATATGGTGEYTYSWDNGSNDSELSGIGSGEYILTVTDENACHEMDSISIESPEPLSTSIELSSDYNGYGVSCQGARDGFIQLRTVGGTGDYSYMWPQSALTLNTISDVQAGSFKVNVKDSNGCKDSINLTMSEPPALDLDLAASSDISCAGGSNGLISVIATGGVETFEYSIDEEGLQSSPIFTELTAGVHVVTAHDMNNCPVELTHELMQPEPLTILLTRVEPALCADSVGSAQVTVSGGVGTYVYNWSDNKNNDVGQGNTIFGLPAGIYTLTVADGNGCSKDKSVGITSTDGPAISIDKVVEPSCSESADGSISISVSEGNGPFLFGWSNGQDSTIVNGLTTGLYIVSVTDADGCVATKQTELTAPEMLGLFLTDSIPPRCHDTHDGSFEVQATGGTGPYQYNWNVEPGSKIDGLSNGTYVASVTDAHACRSEWKFQLFAPDPIDVRLLDTQMPSCTGLNDGLLAVEASGGTGDYDFLWSTNKTGSELDRIGAGVYTLESRDSNGCTVTNEFSLGQPDSLEIHLQAMQGPTCFNSCDGRIKIKALGGAGKYTYEWSNSEKTTAIEGLCAGQYTATIEDTNHCTSTAVFELVEPDSLTLDLVEMFPATCQGSCDAAIEVSASGGTGSYHYEWSDGQNGKIVDNICPGTYTVMVKDHEDCQASAQYTIAEPPALDVDLGAPLTLCVGQSHTLDPGNWASYSWGSNSGLSSNKQQITVSEAGRYWVEVTSTEGCVARDTFLLETSLDLLEASFLIPSTANIGDTVVMIDISWPLPDSIIWGFPQEMTTIADMHDIVFGQFNQQGEYEIFLNAHLGECVDNIGKTLVVVDSTAEETDGRLGYQPFVESFSLAPNPNHGVFAVNIEMIGSSDITLTIRNPVTSRVIAQRHDDGASEYEELFDLGPLSPGMYVLCLDHKEGRAYARFVVE